MTATQLPEAVAIGVGATLTMDVWNLFLRRTFGLASLDFCLLGRWVGYMPRGRLRHERIAAAAPRPFECPLGWVVHYGIGVALAIGFIMLSSGDWLAHPTPLMALGYGVFTVAAPFLILQPSLGLGVAASKSPHPTAARLKSLASHAAFGAGLFLSASGVRVVIG